MCTCICHSPFFGRTLDLDRSFGEDAVIMPRRFPLELRYAERVEKHHAIIGCALVKEGMPLWFDAVNEHGLGAAGLNFPEYAVYHEPKAGKKNVASFELIPWLLSLCKNVREAKELLGNCNITPDAVSPDLPPTPMHWMIADAEGRSLVAESVAEGLKIYDNPFGVMTNPPPFPEQIADAEKDLIPGDWSSHSRFLRALYVKKHTAGSGVSDFFNIMDTVKVPNGCSKMDWHTLYTSCADLSRGEYYFTTCENRRIRKLSLADAELDSDTLVSFSMRGDIESLSGCVDKTQQM